MSAWSAHAAELYLALVRCIISRYITNYDLMVKLGD